MTHIITSLCLRDGSCLEVCPVACMVAGPAQAGWPWMYIDPAVCTDCGRCVLECPWEAIFPEEDVPAAYKAKAGQRLNAPQSPALSARAGERYAGKDSRGRPVELDRTVICLAGDVIDLRPDIQKHYEFFQSGPGYGENS